MGGLFRAPKPVVVPPPPAPIQAAAPAPAPEQQGQDARAAARAQARRGLAGTIATSPAGVLAALPVPSRKSLLGE